MANVLLIILIDIHTYLDKINLPYPNWSRTKTNSIVTHADFVQIY